MSPGRHAAEDSSFRRSASGAMLRGVVLIVVAVALGVVLLAATDGPDPFTAVSGDGDDPAPGRRDTTTTVADETPTSDTLLPVEPPAEVDPSTITVLVANAAGGVAGLAGTLTDQVEAAGYQTAPPTNASPAVDESTVYYATGFEEAANQVAALFDPALEVAPLPDPPPVGDLAGASVVVLAGADLAPQ